MALQAPTRVLVIFTFLFFFHYQTAIVFASPSRPISGIISQEFRECHSHNSLRYKTSSKRLTSSSLCQRRQQQRWKPLNKIAHVTTPIPPPPPLSVPVWSLSAPTPNVQTTESRTSMNIITFATAVSVAPNPKKLWIVSLYENTLTRQSFFESGVGVLQLLTPVQNKLISILGKRSGWEEGFSKRRACAELSFDWIPLMSELSESLSLANEGKEDKPKNFSFFPGVEDNPEPWSKLDILPECALYIGLKLVKTMHASDHDVALCEVVGIATWDHSVGSLVFTEESSSSLSSLDSDSVLYTGQLRRDGII